MSGSNEADAVHGMRPEDGRTDNMLQVAPTKAPIIIVAGRSMRWVSVFIIMRAMCGTASPIKARIVVSEQQNVEWLCKN